MPVTADARGGRRLPRQTQYFDPHTVKAIFENPATGWRESVPNRAWLWMLLFCVIYMGVRGLWRPFAITVTVLFGTLLLAWPLIFIVAPACWIISSVKAEKIMRTHYARRGWYEIDPWQQDDDG